MTGPSPLANSRSKAQRLEDQQDVREQDGRIDTQDLGRRDRHLGGQIGTLAKLQK